MNLSPISVTNSFVKITVYLSVMNFAAGCALTTSHKARQYGQPAPTRISASATKAFKLKASSQEKEAIRKISQSIHSIPMEMNDEVREWIHYFAKKDRERFQRFLDRGKRYQDVVENVLEENGLPAELYYLAMIESGYQTHAKSRASAVGVWQFIKGTGSRYGLRIDAYVDERRDPIRATEAAVRYLRDLYNVFGSWHLAMAGYNAGEYRVVRAVFGAKTRDFWELVRKKALPSETRNYIPKFLAAVEIGQNPRKYGFRTPKAEAYPDLVAISVPAHLKIKDIGTIAAVDDVEIAKYNPHLLRATVPPGKEMYEVWVPVPLAQHVQKAESRLASKAKQRSVASVAVVGKASEHKVRRGENLSLIANRYGTTASRLRRINGLKSNRIYPGMRLRLKTNVYSAGKTQYYTVRNGDSLGKIASRFKTTIAKLKKANGLRSTKIYRGTKLKVPNGEYVKYRVRRGDNLTKIAQQFGISVRELKKTNDMKTSVIRPGQLLKVRM